jgi:hypothetical protein
MLLLLRVSAVRPSVVLRSDLIVLFDLLDECPQTAVGLKEIPRRDAGTFNVSIHICGGAVSCGFRRRKSLIPIGYRSRLKHRPAGQLYVD